jgi:heme/copper-type cytochrome/quinol oxidase subunit 1
MTVTEAPRDISGAAAAAIEPEPPAGLAALVGSGDPRTVGKLFVGTSLLFLLVAGVSGVLVALELIDLDRPDNLLGSDVYSQVVTLQSVTGLFLVVLPLLLGLATAVVPLQVGASTVAFPRASAAAYWCYLVGGGLVMTAYAINGGPYGGDDEGVAMFIAALVLVLVALCVATVSVVTTVLAMRAPGMSLRRTPLFAWSMVVAGTVWLLTLPVLAGGLVLTYLDFRYGQQFLGGAAGVYDRIDWAFWQPTVYAFAIPALGIISDIVPVFAQRRLKHHGAAMVLIGLFGALSFGAWAQSGVAIVSEPGDLDQWLYSGAWGVVGVAVVLPLLGLFGIWASTQAAGKVKLSSPLILAQAGGLLVLVGVAAGAATVIEDLDLAGTTWMTAQSYAVLIGALTVGLGGVAFWAPKLYGRLVPEALARLAGTLLLVGTLVVAVPYAIAGLFDQPRPIVGLGADLDERGTVEVLNLIAAIGGIIVVLGGLLAILGLVRTAVAGRSAVKAGDTDALPGDDPWSGHTLEWTTSSPPPVGNYASLLEITSEAPLYDARHAAARATTEASA